MSLDKWLGKEEEEEETEEVEDELDSKEEKADSEQRTLIIPSKQEEKREEAEKKKSIVSKLSKYLLSCSNSKCQYKKTLMKRELTQQDKICPRCKSEMKIRKI
ncbi:MAG: hypothetical protein EU541_00040 [Promethearchaeota archaeon]|nr:MAG: hypothetical protein EU541_00040 [Candidatus Lokiarchaeota archaeon]